MPERLKFGRGYLLRCENPRFPGGNIEIRLPFTVEFDIQRNNFPSNNTGVIKIYNLAPEHRYLLTHDRWDPGYNSVSTINITFFAGYGPGPAWPQVFKGNTQRAWSVREGVNFVTYLDCADGGRAYGNAITNRDFAGGTPIQEVYQALIQDLLPFGVSIGAVSRFVGTLAKGQSFSGSTIDILRQLSNSNFFIDNLKMNILRQPDAIGGPDILINAESGLLGTPIKEDQYLMFDMLFEPRISVGTIVNVQASSSLPTYNGPHRVKSIHHKGTISDAVCGDAITSLSVEAGVFQTVQIQSGLLGPRT